MKNNVNGFVVIAIIVMVAIIISGTVGNKHFMQGWNAFDNLDRETLQVLRELTYESVPCVKYNNQPATTTDQEKVDRFFYETGLFSHLTLQNARFVVDNNVQQIVLPWQFARVTRICY
jgi:hypothetical protein